MLHFNDSTSTLYVYSARMHTADFIQTDESLLSD